MDSNSGCLLLSEEYKGTHEQLLIKCKCGDEFYTPFVSFKHSNKMQCNKCSLEIVSRKNKLSYVEVKHFIEVVSGSGCELLSNNYKNNRQILLLKCACGNEFCATFNQFSDRNKQTCNDCSESRRIKLQTKTHDEFIEEVNLLVGDEYTFLEKYTKAKSPLLCRHNKCKYEYKITPNAFLRGRRCPQCFKNHKKTTDIFKKEIFELIGDEYTVLGEYVDTKTKILMLHNLCGYTYNVAPNKFLTGRRCPQCGESKGEQEIKKHLKDKNITLLQEYTFNDLIGVGGGMLRFDFAIFNKDNNLDALIEYDGIFHYEKQYDDDGFETIQIHDKRKNKYCKDNNIPLLRIPYWDFDNIDKILEEWLIKEIQLN